MPMHERDYLRRPDKYFHKVYNSGVINLGKMEKQYDDYGTPLESIEFNKKKETWYRNLGVTANDVFYARADDKEISRKVAVRGFAEVDVKWHAQINKSTYAIYRVYYNHKEDETEISLAEVDFSENTQTRNI